MAHDKPPVRLSLWSRIMLFGLSRGLPIPFFPPRRLPPSLMDHPQVPPAPALPQDQTATGSPRLEEEPMGLGDERR